MNCFDFNLGIVDKKTPRYANNLAKGSPANGNRAESLTYLAALFRELQKLYLWWTIQAAGLLCGVDTL